MASSTAALSSAFAVNDPDATDLSGKAVVITGGTSGIGLATARLLAARGARVLVFSIKGQDLAPALDAIRAAATGAGAGGQAHGLVADVANADDVRRVFTEADDKLGGVDILINNAAVAGVQMQENSFDDWKRSFDVNVVGYIACCREAVDRMRRRGGGGHIVNVGSMSATLREPGHDVYVATKAAIQGFAESLRKELNPDGIRVTLIEPGLVGTPLTEISPARQRQKEQEMTLLKPHDIAEAIVFCLTRPARCDVVSMQVRPTKQVI